MKILGKFLTGLLLVVVTCILLLYLFDQEYILKGLKVTYLNGHTTAYIDDYEEFENRRIEADKSQPWPLHSQYNQVSATPKLQEINEELQTVAFLVIKNDSIWYEHYSKGYGPNSRTNSFSMAKSIVSALLGKAIQEGKIQGLDQPVSDFFPKFDPRLTVGDLASMSSGLNWDESYYNPFSMTAEAYFGENIRSLILDLRVVEEPGKKFKYLSGNTQLLAMVIEKATGKTLSDYLSQGFWKPMGMAGDALWQLDSRESGMEKAYCCIASSARNFARFGKLYMNNGRWNGDQLLDSSFVATSVRPRFKASPQYGYGWWLENYKGKRIYYMRGILGQYVIVVPEDNLIITRLGKERIPKSEDTPHSKDFYLYLEATYDMLGNPL